MGPWNLGAWFRPLAFVSVAGCVGLIVIGVQPNNEIARPVVAGVTIALLVGWLIVRKHFPGPPQGVLDQHRLDEIHKAEAIVHQAAVAEEAGRE